MGGLGAAGVGIRLKELRVGIVSMGEGLFSMVSNAKFVNNIYHTSRR